MKYLLFCFLTFWGHSMLMVKSIQNNKNLKHSLKYNLTVNFTAVGELESINYMFVENRLMIQKKINNVEVFCYEYPLDSNAIIYINRSIDDIYMLKSTYFEPAIDGYKYNLYLLKFNDTIKSVIVENTDLKVVDNLLSFAYGLHLKSTEK